MIKRYCIFHIPYEIKGITNSGSSVRPNKMIEAFKNIGYEVDAVTGYGRERKKQIKKIKKNIREGRKYDFLYSESSNLPTLLTEKNHIPIYPFLDFNFFCFCKSYSIKIGLFYRDVHWKFQHFKKDKNIYKLMVGELFYRYDLKKYEKTLDVLYVPSKTMIKHIPIEFHKSIQELPPGGYLIGENIPAKQSNEANNQVNIFYVGGLGSLYNLEVLFQAVERLEFIKLTVCCRQNEWTKEKEKYKKYLNTRVQIVHGDREDLETYYNEADILNLFVEPTEYWEIAIPIKLYEYLSYKKPIIAVKSTAVGKFIEENDVGWNCEYSLDGLIKLLDTIYEDKINESKNILSKKNNMIEIMNNNTWESRAKKVSEDLR